MAQWPWVTCVTQASHTVNKRISPLARAALRMKAEPDHSSDLITSGFPFQWTKPRGGSWGAGLAFKINSASSRLMQWISSRRREKTRMMKTKEGSRVPRPPGRWHSHQPTLLVLAPGTRTPWVQRPFWPIFCFLRTQDSAQPNTVTHLKLLVC